MIKILQKCLIVAMFAIPTIGFLITPNDAVVKGENRVINQFPDFGSDKYFSSLVNWYNDRLLFKLPTVEKLFPVYSTYFKDFNFSHNMFSVEGLNGWMFLGDSSDNVYSQHSVDLKATPAIITKKIAFLNEIKNSFKGELYFVVGPDKHGIYPEFMDPNIKSPGKFRFFNKLRNYIEQSGISVIDNFKVLHNHKDMSYKKSLYYTDDTHWNRYGAFIAFENVMSQVIENYQHQNYEFSFSKHLYGDLIHNIKNPDKDILDDAVISNPKLLQISVTDLATGTEKLETFNSNSIVATGTKYVNLNAIDSRKIIIITDSYGMSFTPYAAEYFKTVFQIHRQKEDPSKIIEIVKKEQPDIVLYVNVERSISKIQ